MGNTRTLKASVNHPTNREIRFLEVEFDLGARFAGRSNYANELLLSQNIAVSSGAHLKQNLHIMSVGTVNLIGK